MKNDFMQVVYLKLTTFSGNLCPGKYFTFSCVWFMISVSFLPSIISSNTYIVTRSLKFSKRAAFAPTIFAMAEPLQEHNNNNQKKKKTINAIAIVKAIHFNHKCTLSNNG